MTRTRLTLSAIALVLASSLAFAQNADPNTAGPTKNDYRLRVVEPAEEFHGRGQRLLQSLEDFPLALRLGSVELGPFHRVLRGDLGHAARGGGNVQGELSQRHGLGVRTPAQAGFRDPLQHPACALGLLLQLRDEGIYQAHRCLLRR